MFAHSFIIWLYCTVSSQQYQTNLLQQITSWKSEDKEEKKRMNAVYVEMANWGEQRRTKKKNKMQSVEKKRNIKIPMANKWACVIFVKVFTRRCTFAKCPIQPNKNAVIFEREKKKFGHNFKCIHQTTESLLVFYFDAVRLVFDFGCTAKEFRLKGLTLRCAFLFHA